MLICFVMESSFAQGHVGPEIRILAKGVCFVGGVVIMFSCLLRDVFGSD
jgi:hypothetical protein